MKQKNSCCLDKNTMPPNQALKLTGGGLKMCCAKRNTASYAELLNMNELTTISLVNLPAGRQVVGLSFYY
jgi:hypothetical protein